MKISIFGFSRRGARPLHKSLAILLVIVGGLAAFFISKTVFSAFAQKIDTTNKVVNKIEFRNSRVREPIEIVEMRSNGNVIEMDSTFQDTAWLKDLTIRFKNVSGKTITHVDLNLLFPETADGTHPKSYSLIYGLYFSKQKPDAPGMKYLRPGEIAEVSLNSTGYGKLKGLVAATKELDQLTRTNLSLQVVYFEDGTQWSAGEMFRQDPANPGNFIPFGDQ